ncbi:hypothetical protein VYU27_008371 [Nannochloropsis oceanica]
MGLSFLCLVKICCHIAHITTLSSSCCSGDGSTNLPKNSSGSNSGNYSCLAGLLFEPEPEVVKGEKEAGGR